tara:strand:- start:1482 stop:2567 length:1086 start_codon:yes stop_codon:yes gene_type:complete
MSYLGNAPRFGDYPVKTFTGNGSLTSFSLDHSVPSDASIIVFINGERKPVGSYTAAGTSTLDFGAGNAPANLASIEVVHLGLEATLNTPADLSVTTGKIVDDAVTADKLANSINTEIAANTAKTGITSGQASAITANTAKVTNATHTGDVTGSTALTIEAGAVDIAHLSATGTPGTNYLRGDNTWATPTDTNTTYSAGAGLDLSTTTFSVESDLRSDVQYIGQDTNDYYHVNTTSHDWYLDGVLDMRLENDGDLHADGDVIAYSTTTASDRKLKDNITTVEDALDKVKQLNGVEFTWKKDGKKSAGVIAQDVEKVLPQAVKIVKDLNSNDEYKTVKYDALISILVESIKELSARVEELESK